MSAVLRVLAPGPFSTLQDLGRPAFQDLGVPPSGGLDSWSLRVGNLLLGNPPGLAAIEMCYAGAHVEVCGGSARMLIAGPCAGEIAGPAARPLPAWRTERLAAGESLRVGPVRGAACAYLVVEGGFAVAPVLGSCSTYVRAGLGGIEGRRLVAGDEIPLAQDGAQAREEVELPSAPVEEAGPIRVVLGPQDDHFAASAIETLLGQDFVVSPEADRIGMRLEGPRLLHSGPADIPSDGTVHGMIQVPPSGQPIILLVDRQTTGGYPKIATVITADLPRVGRLIPGAGIRFASVAAAEGVAIAREQERRLHDLVRTARRVGRSAAPSTERLLATNIVGGVVSAWD